MCGAVGVGLLGGTGVWAGGQIERDNQGGKVAGGVIGAIVGGAGGYYLCKLFEKEEEPKPAPPPPPPPPKAEPPPPEPEIDACAQVIRLRGVNFGFDKAEITPEASVILEEAAILLGDAVTSCPTRKINVEGYTDWTGPEGYNQRLSERRAEAVRDYLVTQGIPAAQLNAVGFGEANPIATNETREGRALNRRVELRMAD
jgi:OOP family OmpA-OmpF porin